MRVSVCLCEREREGMAILTRIGGGYEYAAHCKIKLYFLLLFQIFIIFFFFLLEKILILSIKIPGR